MKKITKKQKMRYIRAMIQLCFFCLSPAVFATAFSGVKEIFKQFSKGEPIILSAFVTALMVICLYTMIFGRFFCGYGCAFGTLGDGVYAVSIRVQKKLKKKIPKLSDDKIRIFQYIKYAVLFLIAAGCFSGIYDQVMGGKNPWDVFSMITAGKLNFTGYETGTVILFLLVLLMAAGERFFCQFLCPLGAVFSLLPVLPFFLYRRNKEECLKGCKACKNNCPARLEIDGTTVKSGECFQCDNCRPICPKKKIKRPIEKGTRTSILIFGIKLAALVWIMIVFF